MGQWNKSMQLCLIFAVFIVVFFLTYLIFKLHESRKKQKRGEELSTENNIVPCTQCQLIAMGEIVPDYGMCPECEQIPPPLFELV